MSSRVQSVRIALAVRPLVVQLDDRQVRRRGRGPSKDPRARHGMLLDRLVLLVGVNGPGLRSTSSLIPILPMSCSSAPRRSVSRSSSVEPHLVPDRDRDRADALGMARGIRVARVERQRQRADGADVRACAYRPPPRRRVAISELNVSVSVSTSRLEPVRGTGRSKSRDVVERGQRAATACRSAVRPFAPATRSRSTASASEHKAMISKRANRRAEDRAGRRVDRVERVDDTSPCRRSMRTAYCSSFSVHGSA